MATWTDVTRILAGLAQVERGDGVRSWRVGGKLLAWERPLRRSDLAALGDAAPDGPILAVHVPLEVKETLLEDEPDCYFTTPHFDGYPAILLRLPVITAAALRELLTNAWGVRAPARVVAAAKKPTRAAAKTPTRAAAKTPARPKTPSRSRASATTKKAARARQR
jgi:hypothetical protein